MQVDRLIDATDLASDLRRHGVERVFVCGLATDYGVKATALDAKANGFDVVVLRDASAAINLERGDEERALGQLHRAGIQISETRSLVEPAA
jgi:nicotinamidase/pyrazinamidase